jgi:mannose-1-phosphate guanylyltransferase
VGCVLPLIPKENIFVVTNQGLADDIDRQLSARFDGSWTANIVIEPESRNTAPALGLAALHLNRIDP